MIIPAIIDQEYRNIKPYLDLIEARVSDTLRKYTSDKGYAYLSRVKTLESLAEKIESGRYAKWSDIDDLVACTIVIPSLSHEKDVISFLDSTFSRFKIKLRGTTQQAPDAFRFDSTRYIAKETIELATPLKLLFEVQIRTAFEHAWSVTTHSLTYKCDDVDWRRLRLAAQLKAVVEQLDMLITGFDETAKNISPHDWPEISLKIDIVKAFDKLITSGLLPKDYMPKDWSRFADNLYTLLKATSKYKKVDRRTDITKYMNILVQEIELMAADDAIPRGLSLLQVCFSILAQREEINDELYRYVPIITEEMELIYPKTKLITKRFVLP
jgi:ppGpp synthetase/RelA/SpoT-type nucleotidyltranferase